MIRWFICALVTLAAVGAVGAQPMSPDSADYHEVIHPGDPPLTRGIVHEMGSIIAFAYGHTQLTADQMSMLQSEMVRIWEEGNPLPIAVKASAPILNHQIDQLIAAQPAAIPTMRHERRRAIAEEASLRPDGSLGHLVMILGDEVRVHGLPMGMMPRPRLNQDVMEAMCEFVAICHDIEAFDLQQRTLVLDALEQAWADGDLDVTWAISRIGDVNRMIEMQIFETPTDEDFVRDQWRDVLTQTAQGYPDGALLDLVSLMASDEIAAPPVDSVLVEGDK